MLCIMSNTANNELMDIEKFLTPFNNPKRMIWKSCRECKSTFFSGVNSSNGKFIEYTSICKYCTRHLCTCQTILYKDTFDYIYNEKTKKCHLCQKIKCKIHLFHDMDDTICINCCNVFEKFMKTFS